VGWVHRRTKGELRGIASMQAINRLTPCPSRLRQGACWCCLTDNLIED